MLALWGWGINVLVPDGGTWTLTRRDGGLGRERPFWLSTALPLTGSSSTLHDSSPELPAGGPKRGSR